MLSSFYPICFNVWNFGFQNINMLPKNGKNCKKKNIMVLFLLKNKQTRRREIYEIYVIYEIYDITKGRVNKKKKNTILNCYVEGLPILLKKRKGPILKCKLGFGPIS